MVRSWWGCWVAGFTVTSSPSQVERLRRQPELETRSCSSLTHTPRRTRPKSPACSGQKQRGRKVAALIAKGWVRKACSAGGCVGAVRTAAAHSFWAGGPKQFLSAPGEIRLAEVCSSSNRGQVLLLFEACALNLLRLRILQGKAAGEPRALLAETRWSVCGSAAGLCCSSLGLAAGS